MQAILVFIDGTICDERHRLHLAGTPHFNARERILCDVPTCGSVACLTELAANHELVYMGARDKSLLRITTAWLKDMGFPQGEVYLGKDQRERMKMVRELKEKKTFVAGIGDRWDDNELHLALGCQSFILKEWEPDWDTVRTYLP